MPDLERLLRRHNGFMVAFDLVLGGGALAAPAKTLQVLGHDPPAPELEAMVRRQAPIWLTFAAAHLVAAIRDEPRDWWALAWLRGTEIATDALWARSPGFTRPGAKTALRLASVSNLAMAIGFGALGRRGR
ncbi:MAG TPA: hypothetical protein VF715_17865 [Thermoleophilaceae bacterium]|jgi:hypothetical protein